MTKFRIINIVLVLLITVFISLSLLGFQSMWIYIIPCVLAYFFILSLGVVKVKRQFFMPIQCHFPNDEKGIFLSFDDGPHENTALILELLKKYDAKGNFFCIGKHLEENPGWAQLLVREGHFLGNHSYSHSPIFPMLSKDKMVVELQKTNALIENLTGKPCKFFRPPFGVTNPTIAKAVKQLNMGVIGWSIRSFDTTDREGNKAIEKIKKNLRSGDIVLLHDYSPQIISILEELLEFIKMHHFKTLTVDVMVAKQP